MTLGKRYIALVPILKFEESADGPNYTQVARDEDGRPIVDHHQLHHNAKLYEHEGIARREANAFAHRHRKDADGFGRVLEVVLDDVRDVDATDAQEYERVERMLLHYTEEEQRLRPAAKAKLGEEAKEITVVWAGEMRDGDLELHAWPLQRQGGQHVGRPGAGVLILHRPTGVAVMEDGERSQLANCKAAMEKLRKIVEAHRGPPRSDGPPNCSDCDDSCNSACGCGDTHHHCGCPCHVAQERHALGRERCGGGYPGGVHRIRQAGRWVNCPLCDGSGYRREA